MRKLTYRYLIVALIVISCSSIAWADADSIVPVPLGEDQYVVSDTIGAYGEALTPDGPLTATERNRIAAARAVSNLANYYVDFWRHGTPEWARNIRISLGYDASQWQLNLNTIQALNDIDYSLDEVAYWALNYASATNTANAGFGYRALSPNHTELFGVNAFYDIQYAIQGVGGYSPSGTHQRVGLGLEYYWKYFQTTVNGYYGLTAPVLVGQAYPYNVWQQVANGADINERVDFGFIKAPWLSGMLTGYKYFGKQGVSNTWGGNLTSCAVSGKLQLTPRLFVSGGYDFGQSSSTFSFSYNIGDAPQPALFGADEVITQNANNDLSYKMLQWPERNNSIVVEQWQQRMPCSIVVPVADNLQQALCGVAVSIVSAPGSAVAVNQTVNTDANGNATFGVPIGQAYVVVMTAPTGYALQAAPLPAINATSTPITTPPVTLTPQSPKTLTIYAQDSQTADPLDGAMVAINGVYVAMQPTSSTGSTTANNIPDVPYSGGSVTLSGYNNFAIGNVGQGVTNITCNMVAMQVASFTVQVTDNNGNNLQGANVQLTPSGGGRSITVVTNASGAGSFSNIPFGNYNISVSCTGYQSATQSAQINSTAPNIPTISLNTNPSA